MRIIRNLRVCECGQKLKDTVNLIENSLNSMKHPRELNGFFSQETLNSQFIIKLNAFRCD